MSIERALIIKQGATFKLPFKLRNKATLEPVILTGYTGVGFIKRKITDTEHAGAFTITFPDPENGGGLIYMSDEATAQLQAGTNSKAPQSQYVYDIKLTSPEGESIRLFQGPLSVDPEVSR